MIKRCLCNAEDKAAAFEEANVWIDTHLQDLAPGVFNENCKVLLKNNLPSWEIWQTNPLALNQK